MNTYIEKMRALLEEIESEKHIEKQLEIINELADVSCAFYNETCETRNLLNYH